MIQTEAFERLADPSDVASRNEMMETREALRRQVANQTPSEAPDEDEQGNRYCLDCAEVIPPARVKAVAAVRCVHCAGNRERALKMGRVNHAGARASMGNRVDD
jgi:DnaK suppressor protein